MESQGMMIARTLMAELSTREECIAQVKKYIDNLNNQFDAMGYTADDLKNMKAHKEALSILQSNTPISPL